MTSMVERVARASFLADYPNDNWGRFGEHDYVKLRYRHMARAAVEAMRQPTAFMADSGDEIFRSILASRYYTIPVWHSMIDAALKETDNANDR